MTETFESGYMICRIDEDEPERGHYWEGAGAGDKDGTRFDAGDPLILYPDHFPVGTRISQLEPDDPEFYRALFEKQKTYWNVRETSAEDAALREALKCASVAERAYRDTMDDCNDTRQAALNILHELDRRVRWHKARKEAL